MLFTRARTKCWVSLAVAMFFAYGQAASSALAYPESVETLALTHIDHCLTVPDYCLEAATQELAQTRTHSREWFRLYYLMLSAEWQVKELSMPKERVERIVELEGVPPVLLATAYTIYAKLLITDGDVERGAHYVKQASALLRQINAVSLSVRRYAELIVLNNYLRQYEESLVIAKWALAQSQSIKNKSLKSELYTAVGHTHFFLADYKKAASYYKQAIPDEDEPNSHLVRAQGLTNTARAYQAQEKWRIASSYFSAALNAFSKIQGEEIVRSANYVKMRFAEVLIAQDKQAQAHDTFSEVDQDNIHDIHQPLFDELSQRLSH